MSRPKVIYHPRPNSTPDAELDALSAVYALALRRYHESKGTAEPAPEPDSCITTQIDRGTLVLKPQQMRRSPLNEGNLDTGGHPLDQY